MKITAMGLVAFTTFFLFILVLLSTLPVGFGLIFFLTLIGQALVVLMVYKVLTDDFKTSKTFEDFYQEQ